MPWPLVQPLPKLVPNPTNKPPNARIGIDCVIEKEISSLEKNENIA